jgi:hypothetical protein
MKNPDQSPHLTIRKYKINSRIFIFFWSIIALLILIINYFLVGFDLKSANLNEWSNFGQSLGISAVIISLMNIVFLAYSIREQGVKQLENKLDQDRINAEMSKRQEQKNSLLEKQLANQSELSALTALINSETLIYSVKIKEGQISDANRSMSFIIKYSEKLKSKIAG